MQSIERILYSLPAEISGQDLFFDIETTGFSPASSRVYLIGCAFRREANLYVRQFFADNYSQEADILIAFANLTAGFSRLVSFNGLGFDLPFMRSRYEKLGITHTLDHLSCLDLFKEVSVLKSLIKLENYKQKTVERFFDCHREDLYSGGELIDVYRQYADHPDRELLNCLLLHNFEDVEGLVRIFPIVNYRILLDGPFRIESKQIHAGNSGNYELFVKFRGEAVPPKAVSGELNGFYVILDPDISVLRIPIYCGELKFFYENYKDYYFLPEEDCAIHKSVSAYVNKDFREKCHAYNCYTRKSGYFLPQLSTLFEPEFRTAYHEKPGYFEMTRDFFKDSELLDRYMHEILNWILRR